MTSRRKQQLCLALPFLLLAVILITGGFFQGGFFCPQNAPCTVTALWNHTGGFQINSVPATSAGWPIEQYASGSNTGGIQEAYTACQNSSANPTGCRLSLGVDETITGNGVVTVIQNRPLYIELQGHTLNFSCSSGVCLSLNAQIGGASEIASMAHGKILYTGSNGSSITSVMQITGTDYTHLNDLVFGPPNGATPTSAANYLLLANFDIAKLDTLAFLNNQGTAFTLGTSGTGCATPATVVTLDNVFMSGNSGSTPAAVFTGCTSDIWVEHSQWAGNTNPVLASIDATGNISHIRFINDQFPSDGDGTSATAIFSINDPNTYANSEMEVTGTSFFAGTPGVNGTVYAFTGAGTNGNLTFTREKNLYVGPYAHFATGWVTGNRTLSTQEQFSGWTPTYPDDVVINGPAGAGIVQASNFLNTTNNPVNIGNSTYGASLGPYILGNTTNQSLSNFALSTGWGTGASAYVLKTASKDEGGLLVIHTGTGTGSKPTVTMTLQHPFNSMACQSSFLYSTSIATGIVLYNEDANPPNIEFQWPDNGTPVSSSGDTPPASSTIDLTWVCTGLS